MTETLRIDVSNCKYTFIHYVEDWRIHCLRYGEPWVVFEMGHKAISSLLFGFESLQDKLTSAEKEIIKLKQQLGDSLFQNYCTVCGKILENCDGKLNLDTSCTLHPTFIFDIKKPWCPACLLSDIHDMEDESIRLQDDITELRRRVNELEEEKCQ